MNDFVESLQVSDFVKDALKRVDRHHYVTQKSDAYRDSPSPLFKGQTISAPHMHAQALDALRPVLTFGSHILDIGSGSGYLTACFGYLVGVGNKDEDERGKVVGIDVIPELVSYSKKVIQTYDPVLFKYKRNFSILSKDGKLGHPSNKNQELYDGIHIGAACKAIPHNLLHQLEKDGIMVIPLEVSPNNLQLCVVTKEHNGDIQINAGSPVRYVPLV
jgi:protein-L-isoaspartate(D-aspartate) O-methyltransferase